METLMCVFHYCFLCNANTGPDANCEVEYSAQILEQPSHTLARTGLSFFGYQATQSNRLHEVIC